MLLILHIFIATASLILASAAFVAPSITKLRASYGFMGLTLASGVALIVNSPTVLLHICLSGILYVTLATTAVVFAKRKLVAYENTK